MEPQAISSDLIRGHIDTIILHTLLDGDKYAQQISDAIEQKSENEYKINQATLYSSLKRLEGLKLVKSYWYDSVDVGGRRKYFQLTENGKNTINENLTSWSFSRGIIDKLMDCSPQPVVKTQIIEKVVEKIVEVPTKEENSTVLAAEKNQTVSVVENLSDVKDVKIDENTQKSGSNERNTELNQDFNFRNVLNGLIKSTAPVQKPIQQPSTDFNQDNQTERIEKHAEPVDEVKKLDFNQTISEIDYNAHRSNNGKIDFGDLTLKAAKEGYKIRISSKDSFVASGMFLINKLNACAALLIYLVVLLEFLIFSTVHGKLLALSPVVTCILIVAFTLFPAFALIRYKRRPNKCVNKQISVNSILTAAIITFDLLLINLAAVMLFNLDFTLYNTLVFVVIPVTLYLDVLIYFVLKYFVAKLKMFKFKHKKTA